MAIGTDPRGAALLIQHAYALGKAVGMSEVARGAMGRVWRLSTDVSAYAVKELFWTSQEDMATGTAEAEIRREVAFREAATAAGIEAPDDLRTPAGHYLYVLPADIEQAVVRVATWVEGTPPVLETPGRAAWIGNTLGRLQLLGFPADDSELDPWWTTTPTTERWLELADLAAKAKTDWADSLRDRIPYFTELATYVTIPNPASLLLSHTDLQPQNVLVDAGGRYSLLDWQVEPQHPADGLAGVLVDWHVHDGRLDIERSRTTLAAYRDQGGTAQLADLTAFGRHFAGYLNHVAGQVTVALDESQKPEHRLHAQWVVLREFSSNPLGLALIEQILEVASQS